MGKQTLTIPRVHHSGKEGRKMADSKKEEKSSGNVESQVGTKVSKAKECIQLYCLVIKRDYQ